MLKYRVLFWTLLAAIGVLFVKTGQALYAFMFILLVALFIFLKINLCLEKKTWKIFIANQTWMTGCKTVPKIELVPNRKNVVGVVWVTVSLYNALTEQTERKTTACIWREKKLCAVDDWTFRECGRMEMTIEKLKVMDVLGINSVTIPCDQKTSFLVFPERSKEVSKEIPQKVSFEDLAENRTIMEFGDVIPYEEGASLSRIHWKLLGKYDELYLKAGNAKTGGRILLLLEPKEIPTEQLTKAVCYLFALGERLLMEHILYEVYLPGACSKDCFLVENERDYIQMQELLLTTFHRDTRVEHPELFQEKETLYQTIYKIQELFF